MQDAARDQGIAFDQAGFDARHGGAAPARPRLLERRRQADRQSRVPEASEVRFRRLSPDSLRRLRSPRHHQQTARARRNSSPAKKAKSSSTTRPSTRNPADKSAIADGSTPTITTPSSPKSRLLLPGAGRARASRSIAKQPIHVGRQSRCRRRHRNPRGHHAQSHGDASAACRLARSAGQACEAGGIAGRARIICASTSRTSPRSPTKNCRTSKTSSTKKCCATRRSKSSRMCRSMSPSTSTTPWRCSARSMATRCA